MVGAGTAIQAPAVVRCAQSLLADGITALALDLGACTHMDSTFLGTLIALNRSAARITGGSFTVAQPSAQCLRELTHTALHKVLHIGEVAPLDAPWSPLSCGKPEMDSFKRSVVAAHQELAALPGATGAAFKNVAARLAEEMESDRG